MDSSVGRAAVAERRFGSKYLSTSFLFEWRVFMSEVLEKAFGKIGARVKVATGSSERGWDRRPFLVDIDNDKDGEHFFIRLREEIDMKVLQVVPKDRHLLLMLTRNQGVKHGQNREEKSKFLCGHDERHWFVAAIPETASAKTVEDAKDALRPADLEKEGDWIRQGEWFFVPCPEFILPKQAVTFHDEPLVRRTRDGRGGKPHIATECYRTGGEAVHVHRRIAPQGFTEEQFKDWVAMNPKEFAKRGSEFSMMARNASVFVRGEIRHPDHKTVKLGTVWHEVKMNRESESLAMSSMVFLD
jgi:hypothetical protein